MLVLKRKPGETIQIGDDITITVARTAKSYAIVGVDAPRKMQIARGEHYPKARPIDTDGHKLAADLLTCPNPNCKHTDTLDGFDTIGACGDANVFCPMCQVEFDSNTGQEHICDPKNPTCRKAADLLNGGPTEIQFAALVEAVREMNRRPIANPDGFLDNSYSKVEAAIDQAIALEGKHALTDDACVDCGRRLTYTARAIGDGRCHVCGHKQAAKLERNPAK